MDSILIALPIVGRFLIGFFYVFFGIWNLNHWSPTLDAMWQKRIPLAVILLALGILTQTICGLMIIFGIYVKLAALILIPFVIIVVNIFHAFWQFEGEIRQLNFLCYITHMTSSLAALILLLNTIEPNITLMALLTY